jgi:hypothetical protein
VTQPRFSNISNGFYLMKMTKTAAQTASPTTFAVIGTDALYPGSFSAKQATSGW